MKWHEGLKKWVGYFTIIPVAYLVCRNFPLESAKIYLDFAFKVFLIFVIGDVVAEHLIGKWFNGKG